MPEKDKVQDEVAWMQSLEIKTTNEKDTTLNFPVWQENRTCKALQMHVTSVIDAIKKHGHFEDYEKAAYTYEKARKDAESARAGLALLEEGGEILKKASKKRPRQERRKLLRRYKNQRLLIPRLQRRLQKKVRHKSKPKLLLLRKMT